MFCAYLDTEFFTGHKYNLKANKNIDTYNTLRKTALHKFRMGKTVVRVRCCVCTHREHEGISRKIYAKIRLAGVWPTVYIYKTIRRHIPKTLHSSTPCSQTP